MERASLGRVAIIVIGGALAVTPACGSDQAEPPCLIVGTYTMTSEIETGECELTDGDGGAPRPFGAAAYTISQLNDGRYLVAQSGTQGGCAAVAIGECQIQANCGTIITDALDPSNNRGTVQLSWTFNRTGFTGFNAIRFPPAKTAPNGCSMTTRATGTRR